MIYESELRRLQRLLRAGHEAYLDELDRPWSGMDEDLALAVEIMLKHAATSGGQLPLLEACDLPEDPKRTATATLPRWWMEIITTFRALYDPAEAEYRTHKVLNELIGEVMGRGEAVTPH